MKVWVVFSTWYKYLDEDCPINEVKGIFQAKKKLKNSQTFGIKKRLERIIGLMMNLN